jgi:hypothetical protein
VPTAPGRAAPPPPILAPEHPPGPRGTLRNASIYGGFSSGVLVTQIVLFVVLDENVQLPLAAPLCLLVLPVFAWLAGFLTIGLVARQTPGGGPTPRSPRLGAVICALPDLLLCAAVGVLFVANRVSG